MSANVYVTMAVFLNIIFMCHGLILAQIQILKFFLSKISCIQVLEQTCVCKYNSLQLSYASVKSLVQYHLTSLANTGFNLFPLCDLFPE